MLGRRRGLARGRRNRVDAYYVHTMSATVWVMEVLETRNNNLKHVHCRVKEEVLLSRRAP